MNKSILIALMVCAFGTQELSSQQVWDWTASGANFSASGQLVTDGNANAGFVPISSFTGTYDASSNIYSITGLIPTNPPAGTVTYNGYFIYDNNFQGASLQFNNNGVLFGLSDGGMVNIYSLGSQMIDYKMFGTPDSTSGGLAINFSASLQFGMPVAGGPPGMGGLPGGDPSLAVPEPKTYLLLGSILGIVTLSYMRRRAKA